MNIWGKIIGGTAGFALGGPIGGLLGALAGHAVDTYTEDRSESLPEREVAFTIALIALSAKMAKADGVVTRDEILAFREKIDIPQEDIDNVSRLWDLARQTPDGFDGYARQIAGMFPKDSPILEQMMELLFFIARADGNISPAEEEYLGHVARILGYDNTEFSRLKLVYGDPEANPFHVLGVDLDADDAVIRQAWITMARDNHPDRLMSEGLPEEFIRAANERLAAINHAYETIKALRAEKN
jgi:DnaJ like chaperone protein